jgi:predicted enzyme related to lactoylglutathione lyase
MTTEQKSSVILAHLRLSVSDLTNAVDFFEAIGGERDTQREGFTVVELRDNTRLQLTQSSEPIRGTSPLQFDFKVEDIDAAWQTYSDRGLAPSDIARRNPGHDSFILKGPDGCEVKINSGFNRAN